MSKETKPRKSRSTKKSTSELEAKIAELEAKLGQLSSQVKPAEYRETTQHSKHSPPPAPKPRPAASGPTHGTLPAGMAPPKPKEQPKPTQSTESSGEIAPAYATISSTGYTGNKYYATRARLSYHPPDKQYKGESVTLQTSRPAPPPASA